jgi:dihydrolipoamide dehydrogenase
VLQAVGRCPNGKKIAADKAGVTVTDRGFISVDIQMRTNVPHIFAIGDIVGQPMLAHKAVHEANVTAEVIAGELMQGNEELAQKLRSSAFNARVIPSLAYTDPEVAWVGLIEDQAKAQGIKVKKGLFPWAASGRAIANGRDEGVTKLLFDDSPEAHGHGKILGSGMVGTHAGDMIGEIAWRSRWGRTRWILARRFTRIRHLGNPSAWRQRWRTAVARICRLRGSNLAFKLPQRKLL